MNLPEELQTVMLHDEKSEKLDVYVAQLGSFATNVGMHGRCLSVSQQVRHDVRTDGYGALWELWHRGAHPIKVCSSTHLLVGYGPSPYHQWYSSMIMVDGPISR